MLTLVKTFFWLGCLSFGGPAAHIGYFRQTFVEKLSWLSDEEYAQLVALSQFLPGPGSSQVGFAIGYKKQGVVGGFLAFLAFTTPSILLMILFASLSTTFMDSSVVTSITHGLKLLAVVVVADAIVGMYKSFCKESKSAFLALFVAVALLIWNGILIQIIVLVVCALLGMLWFKPSPNNALDNVSKKVNVLPLFLFIAVLSFGPWLANSYKIIEIFSQFFNAGSLVFGGGHVVLPLLESMIGEQVGSEVFLSGYAAAQAVPGPMFTFATFLGYHLFPQAPIIGSLVATMAIFLPGFLLVLSVIESWKSIAAIPKISGALVGINAGVVGLLIAALYQPIFVSSVHAGIDFALVLIGFFLLKKIKLPIVYLVLFYTLSAVIFL
jgi:chromate transporter